MWIFAGVPGGGSLKGQWGCRRRHFWLFILLWKLLTLWHCLQYADKDQQESVLLQVNRTMPL